MVQMTDCKIEHPYSHEKYIIYGDLRRFMAGLSGIHKTHAYAYSKKKEEKEREK